MGVSSCWSPRGWIARLEIGGYSSVCENHQAYPVSTQQSIETRKPPVTSKHWSQTRREQCQKIAGVFLCLYFECRTLNYLLYVLSWVRTFCQTDDSVLHGSGNFHQIPDQKVSSVFTFHHCLINYPRKLDFILLAKNESNESCLWPFLLYPSYFTASCEMWSVNSHIYTFMPRTSISDLTCSSPAGAWDCLFKNLTHSRFFLGGVGVVRWHWEEMSSRWHNCNWSLILISEVITGPFGSLWKVQFSFQVWIKSATVLDTWSGPL